MFKICIGFEVNRLVPYDKIYVFVNLPTMHSVKISRGKVRGCWSCLQVICDMSKVTYDTLHIYIYMYMNI